MLGFAKRTLVTAAILSLASPVLAQDDTIKMGALATLERVDGVLHQTLERPFEEYRVPFDVGAWPGGVDA